MKNDPFHPSTIIEKYTNHQEDKQDKKISKKTIDSTIKEAYIADMGAYPEAGSFFDGRLRRDSLFAKQIAQTLETIAPKELEDRIILAQELLLHQATASLEAERSIASHAPPPWKLSAEAWQTLNLEDITALNASVIEAKRDRDALVAIEDWKYTFRGMHDFEIDGVEYISYTIDKQNPPTIKRPLKLISHSETNKYAKQGHRISDHPQTVFARFEREINAARKVWCVAEALVPGRTVKESLRRVPLMETRKAA